MKARTKLGLGVTITAVSGIYAAVYFSEKIIDKLEHETTRHEAKKVVKKKFNGNEKLLDIIDNLSDDELEVIDNLIKKKLKKINRKIKDYKDE